MKHFGRLDIVVNNAGVFDESIVRWSSAVNINYVSCHIPIILIHTREASRRINEVTPPRDLLFIFF